MSIGLTGKYNVISCFYCFLLALINQSWNQASAKPTIWSVGFFIKHKWMTKVRNLWWYRTLNWKSSNLDQLYELYLSTDRIFFYNNYWRNYYVFKWYDTFSTSTRTLIIFLKRSNFVTKWYFKCILVIILYIFVYRFWFFFHYIYLN